MAINRHPGQEIGTFPIKAHPAYHIALVKNHGQVCRIMQARKCACHTLAGSANLFCKLCKGDGYLYNFQRKFLMADEDSVVKADRSVVLPFRVPVLEPLSVERVLYDKQGGAKKYRIEGFDGYSIRISGNPLPLHWQLLRVSYYFDGYNYADKDLVNVDPRTNTIYTTATKYDGGNNFGNIDEIHGDITIVDKIRNRITGYEYKNFEFRRNQIQIPPGEPALVRDQIEVSYYFAPPTLVLPSEIITENSKEQWEGNLSRGDIRVGLESWWELGEGDLITFLNSDYIRQSVILHNGITGIDRINEFEVYRIDDTIIDESGKLYFKGQDFFLHPFRNIVWIGNSPGNGKAISVKYTIRPTFKIFIDNPIPNNLENRQYPKVFAAKFFNMFKPKDVELGKNPEYSPEAGNVAPVGIKFIDL